MFQEIKRKIYSKKTLNDNGSYANKTSADILEVTDYSKANLIGSLTENGMHAPVLDLDYPVEVYPSSQPGHSHLYLNKEISWENYKVLLSLLATVGLIEPGYANASINHGQSYLRPPGVQKPGGVPQTKKILAENARLRKENYELIQKIKLIEQQHIEQTKNLIQASIKQAAQKFIVSST